MAQLSNIESSINSSGFFKFSSLGQFIQNFTQVVLVLGSIASFTFLLWGGLEFILSSGNQDKTKAAKSKVTSAVTGLALLALIWIIWRLTLYFLGLSNSPSGSFQIKIPKP